MNFSHLANKLRSKITRFSGLLSQDLDKTAKRFEQEGVYGIMASQSVMLTDFSRKDLASTLPLRMGVSIQKGEIVYLKGVG